MLLTVRVVVDGGVVDARADRCYDYAVKMMFLNRRSRGVVDARIMAVRRVADCV